MSSSLKNIAISNTMPECLPQGPVRKILYELTPDWTQKFKNSTSILNLVQKLDMSLSEFIGKTINFEIPSRMTFWDYLILLGTLFLALGIGFYFYLDEKRYNKTRRRVSVFQKTDQYLLGGRSMKALPVSLSLTASFMSALTVLGLPVEIYIFGSTYFYCGLVYLLDGLLVANLFIPILYELNITTAYQYFKLRFSRKIEFLASFSYVVSTIIYLGIVVYAPSLAMVQLTQINVWVATIMTVVICMIYTSVGGLKAVVWTDVVQSGTIMSGFVSIIVVGIATFGSFGNLLEINKAGGRTIIDDFRTDITIRHSFWAIVFGGMFSTWGSIYCANQSMIQRYLCCDSVKTAKNVVYYSIVGLWVILILAGTTGFVTYAFFMFCDPIDQGYVSKVDQTVPYLAMEILKDYPGLLGLYAAGVYAGSLSTVSSGLNSISAVVLVHWLGPTLDKAEDGTVWRFLSQFPRSTIAKYLVWVSAVIILIVSFFAPLLGPQVLIAAWSSIGTLGGPVMALFIVGFLLPYADDVSAFWGYIAGNSFAIFAWYGHIFINGPKTYELNPLKRETCLCGVTNTSSLFDSANHNYTLSDSVIDSYPCLDNLQYMDPLDQDIPKRTFMEGIWHMSYWYCGCFGFFVTLITTWFMTWFRLWKYGELIVRANNKHIAPFLRLSADQSLEIRNRLSTFIENMEEENKTELLDSKLVVKTDLEE